MREAREEMLVISEAKYELYHKDFSGAMKHAYHVAKKHHGITIDPSEIDDKVATGPKKPSEGKTNKYRLKGDKGAVQIQVYNKGGSKPFELNMYKEEVELDEAKMSSSQIAKLKKAYEPMRGKKISTDNANKLSAMMDKVGKDKEALIQLFKADIPFVSQSAVTKLISKHNMKGAEINKLKEEFNIESVDLDEYGGNFGGGPMRVEKGKKKKEGVDEGTKQILAHGGKGKYKVTKDGDKIEIKFGGKVVGTADFDRGADSFFVSIKGEKGQKSFDDAQAIADYFAKNKIKEEVELDEGPMDGFLRLTFKSPDDVKKAMKVSDTEFGKRHFNMDKARTRPEIDFEGDKDDLQNLKDALKSAGIKFEIDLEEEEVDEAAPMTTSKQDATTQRIKKRMKDKKEEDELDEYGGNFGGGPMRVTSGKKKKDKKEGVDEAAPMATSKQDATTQRIRKRMKDKKEGVDEAEDFKPHKMYDPETGKAYDVKTMEDHLKYKKMGYSHEKPNVEESAASDARRAIALDPSTKQKFSKNVSATDDDVKSADKNIMMQMRKAVSLRGNKVEFMDKKKVEIPQKIAQAVLDKYNSQKRPADKEKFQTKVSKSYNDLLQALKETNEKMDTFHEVKSLMRKFRENDNG